ncbi:hypothetical protein Clacol_002123 [Clathrus columnatus]|uniref:Uncharacterized protein n=1 Tax=Clathrus columnatus TaxID=1419009 RepID=A0AAV5A394_9AGAM|nr:hypothetical protein Clacol_002123 [Clathrus columnatus]
MLECYEIQYAALKQALFWRSNGALFSSKLTVLYWTGPLKGIEYLPSLVTSTLQVLQLELDLMDNPNMLDVFCKTIPLRSPSLRALEFSFPPADNDTQAVSELVLIRLPSHCMTGELFTTLSRLPQLQDLSSSQHPYYLCTDGGDIMETLPKGKIENDEEASRDLPFRSLRKIDIPDSDFMMAETLRRGIPLLKLIDLTWGSFDGHTITFMESLHRTCPNLEEISIFVNDGLPFQAIRSLLKCPALVKIVSAGSFDMNLEDIVTIATNRSSWKSITLPSVKPVSYHALIPFAQNCPDLYELQLTLDSRLGVPDLDAFTTNIRFLSLASLHIIKSWELTPDFKLALFLSKICPNPIKNISYGGS